MTMPDTIDITILLSDKGDVTVTNYLLSNIRTNEPENLQFGIEQQFIFRLRFLGFWSVCQIGWIFATLSMAGAKNGPHCHNAARFVFGVDILYLQAGTGATPLRLSHFTF